MPRRAPERLPLQRASVLAAAVALADVEGADAVSMRRLADALGVVPMALYKHVADKEDLLDGMVDTVIGEFDRPDPAAAERDWPTAVREVVLSARRAVIRHPWLRRALETRTVRTPAVLGHMEVLTGLLLAGGLSPDLAHHAMHALGNRIWGFSPELFNDTGHSAPRRPGRAGTPDPADYPGILAVSADARARRPDATGCDEEYEFGFALDLLLDGVRRLHEAGWASSDR